MGKEPRQRYVRGMKTTDSMNKDITPREEVIPAPYQCPACKKRITLADEFCRHCEHKLK